MVRGEMGGGDSHDLKRMRVDKFEDQIIEDSHEERGSAGEMERGDSSDLERARFGKFVNLDQFIEYYNDDDLEFEDSAVYVEPVIQIDEFEKDILDNVDKVAADVYITQISEYAGDPTKQIFLLKEPPADYDCSNWDYVKRTLPIYYKRMLPNTVSALEVFHPYEWNRLPEVDLEYVRLYNRLHDCSKIEKMSWLDYNKLPNQPYCLTAKAIANELNIQKLKECEIEECLRDLFFEVDVECMLKFEKEYDFFLLDCFLNKKWPKDTDPITYPPPNTCHGPFPFGAVIQQRKFLRWMKGLKDTNVDKAELEKLLIKYREKVEKECCATRIRYVKFKRALAKQLRLIPDDTE